MHRQRRQFPLIPDGEPCLQEPVSMRLYENEDLITNIRGPYQDKDYNDLLPNYDFLSAKPSNRKQAPKRVETQEAGMTYADSKVDYLSYGEAIDQMKNGQCDAAFVTSGLGNATIKELGTTKKIVFVPIEGDQLKKLMTKYPYYIEWKIPKDVYGTDKDTTTAAVMNVMLVAKSLPDEVVYDLVKGFYDAKGLEVIGGSHATAKKEIKLDTALRGIKGTKMVLHPGAAKFYAEKGIK